MQRFPFSIHVVYASALLAVAFGLLNGPAAVAQVELSLHTAEQDVEVPNGSTVTLPLTLENRSRDRTATGVTVEMSIPTGATVVADSASRGRYDDGTWTVGSVTPGRRETLRLRLTRHASTPRVLTAQLGSVEPDDPTGAILRIRAVPGRPPKTPTAADASSQE